MYPTRSGEPGSAPVSLGLVLLLRHGPRSAAVPRGGPLPSLASRPGGLTAQFVLRLADGAPPGADGAQWLSQRSAIDPERIALYMTGRRPMSIDDAHALATDVGRDLVDVLREIESADTPRTGRSNWRAEQGRNAHAQCRGYGGQVIEGPLGLPVQPRRNGLPTDTES